MPQVLARVNLTLDGVREVKSQGRLGPALRLPRPRPAVWPEGRVVYFRVLRHRLVRLLSSSSTCQHHEAAAPLALA